VIEDEAVILAVNSVSDFNALHSSKQNHEVQLCAIDVLAMEGKICEAARRHQVSSRVRPNLHSGARPAR
jgi:hypothetical protein